MCTLGLYFILPFTVNCLRNLKPKKRQILVIFCVCQPKNAAHVCKWTCEAVTGPFTIISGILRLTKYHGLALFTA